MLDNGRHAVRLDCLQSDGLCFSFLVAGRLFYYGINISTNRLTLISSVKLAWASVYTSSEVRICVQRLFSLNFYMWIFRLTSGLTRIAGSP